MNKCNSDISLTNQEKFRFQKEGFAFQAYKMAIRYPGSFDLTHSDVAYKVESLRQSHLLGEKKAQL